MCLGKKNQIKNNDETLDGACCKSVYYHTFFDSGVGERDGDESYLGVSCMACHYYLVHYLRGVNRERPQTNSVGPLNLQYAVSA